MRSGCFLVLIAVALLIGGGQGLYMGLVHRECTTLSYPEFARLSPRHGWFQINGCSLNLLESIFKKRLVGGVKEVFIPVRDAARPDDGPTRLLLLTKDRQILDTIDELQKVGKSSDPGAALRYVVENKDRLTLKKDVRGMLQYGIDVRSKVNDKLAKLDETLAKDFVVLEEGKEPQLFLSMALFVAGLLLVAFLGRRAVGGARASGEVELTPLAPEGGMPPPGEDAPR